MTRAVVVAKYVLLAGLVGAVLFGMQKLMANPELIQAVLDGAKEHPAQVIPLYMLANFAAPLAVLPGGPFQLLAGAIWGVPLGFAVTVPITFAAYVAAFVVGRRYLQARLTSTITANFPSFPAIQAAILSEGWSLVLMLRLSPVLPDSVMNYALSLTSVSLGVFCFATGSALIPWSLVYLYLGSASKDIVAMISGGGSKEPHGGGDDPDADGGTDWVSLIAGGASLALAVGAVAYLARVVKKAVDKAERDMASARGEGGRR
ncbi:hypothetical protein FOA52_014512 [Chlamydomonas sp. UWO 241]|nr:hypothetical protein FOA52_014512 [Chlamydomonas sp. UWO 241]